MNTTSIANVDDNDTATAIATNTLSNGVDDAERTITSPFFSLPRELRDEIYALAALDETTLYCEITLTADAHLRRQHMPIAAPAVRFPTRSTKSSTPPPSSAVSRTS